MDVNLNTEVKKPTNIMIIPVVVLSNLRIK